MVMKKTHQNREWRRRISAALTGRKLSKATRRRMRIAALARWARARGVVE